MDENIIPEEIPFEPIMTRLKQYKGIAKRMESIIPEANNLLWFIYGSISATPFPETCSRFNRLNEQWKELLVEHYEWSLLFANDMRNLQYSITQHMEHTNKLAKEALAMLEEEKNG